MARWDQMIAMIEAPPVDRRTPVESVRIPAALPPGTPVTAAQQAAAFDAFAAMA